MENEIVNRVAKSPLVTLDLEALYPKGPRFGIDISQWLEEGLVLREKPFREALAAHDWSQYQDGLVALFCTTDAIVPAWAFLLITSYLNPIARLVVAGSPELLEAVAFRDRLRDLDLAPYDGKPVIIKGCSKKTVPESAYLWALEPYGRYGWLAAFLYVATTALRLARFNSLSLEKAPKDFVGLPCPAAAGMIATTVLFSRFLGATETVRHVSILILVYLLSYLMVSNIRYVSFKHPAAKRKKTFHVTVAMVLLLILVAAEPPVTLFVVGLVYVLSGPFSAAYRLMHRTEKSVEEQENTV